MRRQKYNPYAFDPRARAVPKEYCETSGKVMFSKKDAATAANKRFKEDHEELRIYPCPYCSHWHLTSRV